MKYFSLRREKTEPGGEAQPLSPSSRLTRRREPPLIASDCQEGVVAGVEAAEVDTAESAAEVRWSCLVGHISADNSALLWRKRERAISSSSSSL